MTSVTKLSDSVAIQVQAQRKKKSRGCCKDFLYTNAPNSVQTNTDRNHLETIVTSRTQQKAITQPIEQKSEQTSKITLETTDERNSYEHKQKPNRNQQHADEHHNKHREIIKRSQIHNNINQQENYQNDKRQSMGISEQEIESEKNTSEQTTEN